MSITIRRRTGWLASLIKFNIRIDSQLVDKIARMQTKEIELPSGRSVIQIWNFGMKSNKLEVKDGQSVEINTNINMLISILVIPVIIYLLRALMPVGYYWVGVLIFMLAFLLYLNIVPTLSLRLLAKKHDKE